MKKLILSVLCASASLGAFAQNAPQAMDTQELARWIWDNKWVPCKMKTKKYQPEKYKEFAPVSFSANAIGFVDNCNSCGDAIEFEVDNTRFRWVDENRGPRCTELRCLRPAKESFKGGLHGLRSRDYVSYRRVGDQLIFTANNSEICMKPLPKK